MRKIFPVLAVTVPFVLLLAFLLQNVHERSAFPSYKIKISGYDPRDLLHGHYLQFRLDWNYSVPPYPKAGSDDNRVLCLTGKKNVDPLVQVVEKQNVEHHQCQSFVQGKFVYPNNFDIGISEYYVPEEYAQKLEELLRNGKSVFRIEFSVDKEGLPHIKNLYVDELPLDTFILNNQ
jgi:uncharacterized membrane-anchored protein